MTWTTVILLIVLTAQAGFLLWISLELYRSFVAINALVIAVAAMNVAVVSSMLSKRSKAAIAATSKGLQAKLEDKCPYVGSEDAHYWVFGQVARHAIDSGKSLVIRRWHVEVQ